METAVGANTSDEALRKLIKEFDYIDADELARAEEFASSQEVSLADALQRTDVLSDEELGKLIAYSSNLPFVSLQQVRIPEQILQITPKEVAIKQRVVTFGQDAHEVKIATSNPDQKKLFELIAKKADVPQYRLFYATDRDIDEATRQYRQDLQVVFDGLFKNAAGEPIEPSVATIIDTIIDYAYGDRASDVHIEPTRADTVVRFRIDGVLHDMVHIPKKIHEQVINRIKVLARLRTDDHFSAQDGRIRLAVREGEDVDVRVSVVPIISGEKVVLRLLSSHYRQFGLTDLGMAHSDLQKLQRAFRRPYGMVLSTGPTGSGKTTTIYAILKIINTREKNIATIEDPVEYEIDGINQIQANKQTNLTFANGLRSILRQDPNVIYVGEIRDRETADITINAALTGHLVFSTLHTNNAATSLPRLIDMQIEPFLVASTINAIVGQRLVRKICERCKVSFELTRKDDHWTGDENAAALITTLPPKLVATTFGAGPILRLYRGKGCSACHHTGYMGRIGVFEVLEITPRVEELIMAKADAERLSQVAISEGMTTMLEDGLAKAQRGITTIEELMRVTRE